MIISKIIQNGLELSVETNDIPFQYSANLKIQFIKDADYEDWTLQVYASPPHEPNESEQILLLSVDDEGYFKLPPVFFKKRGKIKLSFSLCGTDDEIIHFGILNIVVKKSIGDTDAILPDDENVWMEYVRAETDRYFAKNYENKLQEFQKKTEEMKEFYNTTITYIDGKKSLIEQDISDFEQRTQQTIQDAKDSFDENEVKRIEAEKNRVTAESDRVDAENARTEAFSKIGQYKFENNTLYFMKADGTYGDGVEIENYDDTSIKARLDILETQGVTSGDTLPIGSIVEWNNDTEIPTGWEEVDPIQTSVSVDDVVQENIDLKTERNSQANKVNVQILDTNGNAVMVETTASQVYTQDGLTLESLLNNALFVLEDSDGITHCGDYERYVKFVQESK